MMRERLRDTASGLLIVVVLVVWIGGGAWMAIADQGELAGVITGLLLLFGIPAWVAWDSTDGHWAWRIGAGFLAALFVAAWVALLLWLAVR